MLENMKLLGSALARMDYASVRQKLIANNIAHVDTPKYQGADLKPFNLNEKPLTQRSTRAEHLGGQEESIYGYVVQKDKNAVYDQTLNKNKISIEDEMVKSAENEASHRLASTVWKQSLSMLKMSIGGR